MQIHHFSPQLLDSFLEEQAARVFQMEADLTRMHGTENKAIQQKLIDKANHAMSFIFYARRELGI